MAIQNNRGIAAACGIYLAMAAVQSAASGTDDSEQSLKRLITEQYTLISRLQRQVDELTQRLDSMQNPSNGKASHPDSPPSTGQRSAGSHSNHQGPGSFAVDVEAAQRALERTLTQTGALLLPAGQFDLLPSVSYTRWELPSPLFVSVRNTITGSPSDLVLANEQIKQDEYAGNLGLQVGLPGESQFELGLPYYSVSQTQLADLGASGRFVSTMHGQGLGDLTLGIAKTLSHEQGWRPDLIGRIGYTWGTGAQQNNGVLLYGGNPSYHVQFVALKRQDPLAFIGSISYQHSFEKNQIMQGNQTGFSIGTMLASSPQTSLQFSFSDTFAQAIQVNGIKIPGSEQNIGMFNLGASSIISKKVMMNVVLGIGLSNDAPKYQIGVTVPILFNY